MTIARSACEPTRARTAGTAGLINASNGMRASPRQNYFLLTYYLLPLVRVRVRVRVNLRCSPQACNRAL